VSAIVSVDDLWRDCAYGQHELSADAALVWVNVHRLNIGRRRKWHGLVGLETYTRAMACVSCFYEMVTYRCDQAIAEGSSIPACVIAPTMRWHGIYRDHSGRWYRPYHAYPCKGCGRLVTAVDDFWRGWCSPVCSRRAYDQTRQLGEPDARECAVCAAIFTPARRDARFCSSACKQTAYRMRKAGMALPNGPTSA
jgi:hypothetical protein